MVCQRSPSSEYSAFCTLELSSRTSKAIVNRFDLRNLTNGRVQPLPVKFWHHLYNRHDDVFTAQIKLPEPSAGKNA